MILPAFVTAARDSRPFDQPGFSGGAGFSWRAVALRCRYEVEQAARGEPAAVTMPERWTGLPAFRCLSIHPPTARQFCVKIAQRLTEAAQSEYTCEVNAFGIREADGVIAAFRLIALHLPAGIAVSAWHYRDQRTAAELYARRPWQWTILPHNERSAKRQRVIERERREAERGALRPKKKRPPKKTR